MLITCKQAAELIGVENHRELQDIAKSTPADLPGDSSQESENNAFNYKNNDLSNICFAKYRTKTYDFT